MKEQNYTYDEDSSKSGPRMINTPNFSRKTSCTDHLGADPELADEEAEEEVNKDVGEAADDAADAGKGVLGGEFRAISTTSPGADEDRLEDDREARAEEGDEDDRCRRVNG